MNASLRTDDVMRYQDARFQTIAAKLLPTQYLVVDDTTALTTTLGSCVAACLRDPVLKIGGMNHFLLPEGNAGDGAPARYGSYAMELLINDMLKRAPTASASKPRCSAAPTCSRASPAIQWAPATPSSCASTCRPSTSRSSPRTCAASIRARSGSSPTPAAWWCSACRMRMRPKAATESAVRARLSKAPVTGGVELFE